jgi:TRAP-type transport system periplasmic protein
VTLTLGHPFPDEHLVAVNAIIPMAEEIEERTNGTVTFEIVPGGGLGPPDGVYENTVAGAQDLGWALQGYTAGRFPITDIIELPFMFDSAQSATEALWTLYEEFPEFQEEYGDVHVLGLWVHDVGDLWMADQAPTDDLGGLTLRAPGPLQNALITEMGGSAVGMGAPEMYDSLERGVINGVMTAATALRSFSLFDVIDYGVVCHCYVAAQFLVVNQASWDQLSESQQQVVDEVAGRNMSMWAAEAYDRIYDEVLAEVGDHGIELVELSDDELARWHEAGDAVVEEWMADAEAAGAPAQAMHERLLELAGQ